MYSRLLIICFAAFLVSCGSTKVSSIKKDVDIPLGENSGYLMLGVELTRNIKSIEISGARNVVLSSEDLEKVRNYFLIEMPAGDYQFDMIRFNRRYRMELKEGYWDFEVKPNEISYVGHLEVRTSGWWFANTFIELENRASDALIFLEENYPNILAAKKVRFRGPGEDKFFEYIEEHFAQETE